MIWDQLTTHQLAAVDRNIPVLLNLAATEQHGAHLPVATDRLIGKHFCFRLHQDIPDHVLILPPVAVGCSAHHMGFAGSLTLRHSTFISVVTDLVTSVMHHGFHKVILLNSHGGNQAVMQVLIEELGANHPSLHIIGITWWNLVRAQLKEITEGVTCATGHACEFETSLMQIIAPALMREKEITKGNRSATFDWAEGDMLTGPAASYFRTMKSMTANGIYGDPTLASPQKGERITALVLAALKKVVEDLFALRT